MTAKELHTQVSVVIPTLRRPALLARALSSVLVQTHPWLDIIVVIDGPDQATEEMLKTIPDERLRVIALPNSVGGSEARNIGARFAASDWVALLDDDDEWFPTKIERQLRVAESAGGKHVLVTSRYVYRSSDRSDDVWPHRLPKKNEPLSQHLFRSCSGFQTSTFFCSKALLLAVPFRAIEKHQDWDWYLRATTQRDVRVRFIPEPLSIYWVPSNRDGVSNGGSWRGSLSWARTNRRLFTKRAYSRFVVKICAQRAAREHLGPKSAMHLLRECLLRGSATPWLIAQLFGMYLVPPNVRSHFRERIAAVRPGKEYGAQSVRF